MDPLKNFKLSWSNVEPGDRAGRAARIRLSPSLGLQLKNLIKKKKKTSLIFFGL